MEDKANQLFSALKHMLVVSCQAEGDSPFNNPHDIAKFAYAAWKGGAAGIRTEGIGNLLAVKQIVPLPVIGLVKSSFSDGYVRITGSEKEVAVLMNAGCDIIAIDGTFREREKQSGPDFIYKMIQKYRVIVMADIASLSEAEACVNAGAHCLSTTLSGYTPDTHQFAGNGPDWQLLTDLVERFNGSIPVFAEGRYNTPLLAAEAIKKGAWSVVTGSAITRPQLITKWFSDALHKI